MHTYMHTYIHTYIGTKTDAVGTHSDLPTQLFVNTCTDGTQRKKEG